MRAVTTLLFSSSIALTACGDDGHNHDHPDAGVDAAATTETVSLGFAARIGGAPFACGQTYNGIGTAASAYVTNDFRFYVHDVQLVMTGHHTEDVPVALDANEYQADGVALLDFEDGGTGCQQGSTGTHTAITGTVPTPGDGFAYTGIKFKVGVPFDRNHLDVATAAAPLNIPAMYWAWSGGYKFIKVDGNVAGGGFNVHLGSTGCGTTGMTPPTGPCTNPNVIEIALSGYTPGTSVVTADVANVLDAVDVSVNTAMTAPGCMSFPGDPECDTVLPKLGLPYGSNSAGTQALFAVE